MSMNVFDSIKNLFKVTTSLSIFESFASYYFIKKFPPLSVFHNEVDITACFNDLG